MKKQNKNEKSIIVADCLLFEEVRKAGDLLSSFKDKQKELKKLKSLIKSKPFGVK